jgi:hypothetical protein
MPRPRARGVIPTDTLRRGLIARTEQLLGRLLAAQGGQGVYDFSREAHRLDARLVELRAGRPVEVRRLELPREAVASMPGVWLFVLGADGEIVPAEYERLRA